ncbi:MAG: dipeptidase [Hespellia sp.]|nr:dipeptidase [Hespellia sp.]
MKLIDLHCDTIWKLEKAERGCGGEKPRHETLYQNTGHIDIAGMKKAGTTAQFFANFIYKECYENDWDKAYEGALHMIERISREIDAAKQDMELLTSYQQLISMQETFPQRIGAFLTIEEGGILNGHMERLHYLYKKGIRLMTLIWNYENCIGYPNSDDAERMQMGLKPFGMEIVEEMNRMGMIVDVSHLSDGGFWDVVKNSKKPVTASHSNARKICSVRRNLTDEMLKALGENGGVAGVNFYPCFVRENAKSTAADLAVHVQHMIQTGGEDLPAVGTDFDGFDIGESEITHVSQMEKFYDALAKAGLSSRQIEKVCCENAQRLLGAVLSK